MSEFDASTIPKILGESGLQAFLHPADIGDCFVVEEEGASLDEDFKWLLAQREKALAFGQTLQYFQDGVVHVGYSAPFFLPNWVNQIRRAGLFFLGEARRTPYGQGKKMYKLGAPEKERLKQLWKTATSPRIVTYLANRKGKLRQAIYRAGQYYESSHERGDPVERLLALAIALESLFSPTDKGELKFRISQAAAQFIGANPADRERIFKSVSDMYDRRSALVHGSYDVEQYDSGKFVSAGEIDEWAGFVRKALLGFLTIYFKGPMEAPRDPILKLIGAANFDDAEGASLRNDSDFDQFLRQLAGA